MLEPLGTISYMDAFRRSSKITRKLNLQSLLNTEFFFIHTESKLGVFGVAKKLVKDVVYSWKWSFENNNNFLFL
jgi:hypothetical protein